MKGHTLPDQIKKRYWSTSELSDQLCISPSRVFQLARLVGVRIKKGTSGHRLFTEKDMMKLSAARHSFVVSLKGRITDDIQFSVAE